MNFEAYKQEVIKRCEPIDQEMNMLIRVTEHLLYGAENILYDEMNEEYSSMRLVSKYNNVGKLNFTQKEQIQIAFSSGIPGVLSFMLMFFFQCKETDQTFSVFEFLQNNGVIKNTLVKEMKQYSFE